MLAQDLNQHQPPAPRWPQSVLVGRNKPPSKGLESWRWLASGAALAGVALVASVVLMVAVDDPATHLDQAAATPQLLTSGFVPVVDAERWQRVSRGNEPMAAWLVPADMPLERMATLGLPFDPARAGDSVCTELLLHESGEVLAVRVTPR